MNLQVVFGSCGGFRDHRNGQHEIDLEDVDDDKLLDDIGEDYAKEHFDLVKITDNEAEVVKILNQIGMDYILDCIGVDYIKSHLGLIEVDYHPGDDDA